MADDRTIVILHGKPFSNAHHAANVFMGLASLVEDDSAWTIVDALAPEIEYARLRCEGSDQVNTFFWDMIDKVQRISTKQITEQVVSVRGNIIVVNYILPADTIPNAMVINVPSTLEERESNAKVCVGMVTDSCDWDGVHFPEDARGNFKEIGKDMFKTFF